MKVFYSVYLAPGWDEICDSQIGKIIRHGLYESCEEIRIFLTGTFESRNLFKSAYSSLSKLKFIKDDEVNNYEWPALIDMVSNYSEHNLYFHTKGITRRTLPTDDWRNLLDFYNIVKWKNCINKLTEGFDVVGVNLLQKPHLHFSGNYFWATGNYLSRFGNKLNCDLKNRLLCEFIILSLQPIAFCSFQSEVNHYHSRFTCPE